MYIIKACSETTGDGRNGKSNLELTKDKLISEIPAPSPSGRRARPRAAPDISAVLSVA